MPEIEIIINKDGTVEIDMINFKGSGCSLMANEFAKALGTTIKNEQKPEYWNTEIDTKQHLRQ